MLIPLREVTATLDHEAFQIRGAQLDEQLVDSIRLERDEVGIPRAASFEFYARLSTTHPADLARLEKLMRDIETEKGTRRSPARSRRRRQVVRPPAQLEQVAQLMDQLQVASKPRPFRRRRE